MICIYILDGINETSNSKVIIDVSFTTGSSSSHNDSILFNDSLNNIIIYDENGTLYEQDLKFNSLFNAYELLNQNQDSNVVVFYKNLQQILSSINPFLISIQVKPISNVIVYIHPNDINEHYAIINGIQNYPIYLNGTTHYNGYYYESILKVFSNQIIKSLKYSTYNQLNLDEIFNRNLYGDEKDKSTSFIKGFIDFFSNILKKISFPKLSNDSTNSILDSYSYFDVKHYNGPKNFVKYSSSSISSSLLDLYDGTIEKSTVTLLKRNDSQTSSINNGNGKSRSGSSKSSFIKGRPVIQLPSSVPISRLLNSFKNAKVNDIESFGRVLANENQEIASSIEQVMFSNRFITDCEHVDCNGTISINNDNAAPKTMLRSIVDDNTGWNSNGTLGQCIFYDFVANEYYDLQPLMLSMNDYYSASFKNEIPLGGTGVGYDIRFNLCGKDNSNSCGSSDVLACQFINGLKGIEYIPVAHLSEQHILSDWFSSSTTNSASMTLKYQSKVNLTSCSANGNRRTLSLHLECNGATEFSIKSTDNSRMLCDYHVYIQTKYMCKNQAKLFDPNTGFLYDFKPMQQLSGNPLILRTQDDSYDILYNLFGPVTQCNSLRACRKQVGNKQITPGQDSRYINYVLNLGDNVNKLYFTDNGVTLIYSYSLGSTSTSCVANGKSWSVTFNFECDQSIEYAAGTYSYYGTCNYNVSIKTKYACPTARFFDNQQVYDFSILQLKSSSYYKAPLADGSFIFFNLNQKFDPCKGLVDNTGYTNSLMKYYSACQVYPDGRAFPIAATNGDQLIKHTYNSISIQHSTPGKVIQCDSNSNRRNFNLNFECDPNQVYSMVSSVESPICVYTITIKSKFACESLIYYNRDMNAFIDLSPLRTLPTEYKTASFLNDVYKVYYGIGNKVNYCQQLSGAISNLDYQSCQFYNGKAYQIGGFLESTKAIWGSSNNLTIEYFSIDSSPVCSLRKLQLQFICDSSTEFTQVSTKEQATCTYLIVINTKYVCSYSALPIQRYPVRSLNPVYNNPNLENQLNGKFYDSLTGKFYDLSPLKRSPDDPYKIKYDGLDYTFNLFGYVSTCKNDLVTDWVQSCQIIYTRYYETGYLTMSGAATFSSTGLSITYSSSISDNLNCGDTPRSFVIEFTCNKNVEYEINSFVPAGCKYLVKMGTKFACPMEGLLIDSGSLFDFRPLMNLKTTDNPFSTSFKISSPTSLEYDFYFNIYNTADICQVKANQVLLSGVYGCLVSKTGIDVVTTFTKPSISVSTSYPRNIIVTYSSLPSPAVTTFKVSLNCNPSKDFIIGSTISISNGFETTVYTKYACPSTRYFSDGGLLNSTQVIDLTPLQKLTTDTPYSFSAGKNTINYNIGNIMTSLNSRAAQSYYIDSSASMLKNILGDLSMPQSVKQTSSGIQIRYYNNIGIYSNSFYEDPLGNSFDSFSLDLKCKSNVDFEVTSKNFFGFNQLSSVSANSKYACLKSSQFILPANPSPCYKYCTPPVSSNQVDIISVLLSLSVCSNEIDDYGSLTALSDYFNQRWIVESNDFKNGPIYNVLFTGGDSMLSMLSKYVTITIGNECTYSTKGLGKVSLKDFTTITNDLITLSNSAIIKKDLAKKISVSLYQSSTTSTTGLGIIKYDGKLCYFGETTTLDYNGDSFLSRCQYFNPISNRCHFDCSSDSNSVLNNIISQGKKDLNSTLLLMGACLEQIEEYDYILLNSYLSNVWTPNAVEEDYTSGQLYKYLNNNLSTSTIKTISKYITPSIHQNPENSNSSYPTYECIYSEPVPENSLDDLLFISEDIQNLTRLPNVLNINYSSSSTFRTFFIPLDSTSTSSSTSIGLSIVLFDTRICGLAETLKSEFESGTILNLCPFGPIVEEIISPSTSVPSPYQYSITIKGRRFEDSIFKVGGIECVKNMNEIINNSDGSQTITCTLPPVSSSSSALDYSSASIQFYNSYSKDITSIFSYFDQEFAFKYPVASISNIIYQFNPQQPNTIPMYSKITVQGENFYSNGFDNSGVQVYVDDVDLTTSIQDKQTNNGIDSFTFVANGYGISNQIRVLYNNGLIMNMAEGVINTFEFSRPVISGLSNYSNVEIGDSISIYGQGLDSLYLSVHFGDESAQILKIISSNEIIVQVPPGYMNAKVIVYNDQTPSLEDITFNYMYPTIDLVKFTSPKLNTSIENSFILVGRALGHDKSNDISKVSIALQDYIEDFVPLCDSDTYNCYDEDYDRIYQEPEDGLFVNDDICPYLKSINYPYLDKSFDIIVCYFTPSISRDLTIFIGDDTEDVDGNENVIQTIKYSYNEPWISSVNNNNGNGNINSDTDGGANLLIQGFNFVPMEAYNLVNYREIFQEYTDKWIEKSKSNVTIGNRYECLNSNEPESLWINSSTINCTIPPGIGANHSIIVTVGGQSSSSSSQLVYFSYNKPVLEIKSYSGPTSNSSSSDSSDSNNNTITITGRNFIPISLVDQYNNISNNNDQENYILIGNERCNKVQWINSTSVKCNPPPGIGVNHRITIYVGTQSSEETDVNYSYFKPTLDSINYNGSTDGSSVITINGTNFIPEELASKYNNQQQQQQQDQDNSVSIDGNYCISLEWIDSKSLKCGVPKGEGKNLDIKVTVGKQQVSATLFSYNAPVIESITPEKGRINTDYTITIEGSNFGVNPKVKVGSNYECTDVSIISNTSLSCVLRSNNEGNKTIIVVAKDQESNNDKQFEFYGPPKIDQLTLSTIKSGVTSFEGGDQIELKGKNFIEDQHQPVVYFKSNGENKREATLKSQATNDTIIINSLDGIIDAEIYIELNGQTSNTVTMEYTSSNIESVDPSEGPYDVETPITISGDNLALERYKSDLSIKVGSRDCSNINIQSSKQITCTAPSVTKEEAGEKPLVLTFKSYSTTSTFTYNSDDSESSSDSKNSQETESPSQTPSTTATTNNGGTDPVTTNNGGTGPVTTAATTVTTNGGTDPATTNNGGTGPVTTNNGGTGPVTTAATTVTTNGGTDPATTNNGGTGPVTTAATTVTTNGGTNPATTNNGGTGPVTTAATTVTTNGGTDPATTNNGGTGPVTTNNGGTGPVTTNNGGTGPVTTNNGGTGPVTTNNGGTGPVTTAATTVTTNGGTDPATTNNGGTGPVTTNNGGTGPATTATTNNGGGGENPATTNNGGTDPVTTNNGGTGPVTTATTNNGGTDPVTTATTGNTIPPTETPIPGGSSSSSNDNDDQYLFNPIITSLSSYNGSTGDMITIYGYFPSSYEDLFANVGSVLLNDDINEGTSRLNYISNTQLSIILPNGYSSINISVGFGYNYSNQVEFTYNAPIILHVDHQNFNTANINRFFVFGINYGSISNQRLVIPFIDHPNGEKQVIHCEIESQCNNPLNQIQSIQHDDPLHPCVDNITLSNNQQYFNESKYDIYVCVLPSPGVGNGTIGFFDDDNMTTVYEDYSFEYSFLAPQISFIGGSQISFNSTIQQGDIITIHGNQFPPTQEIFDMQLNKSSTIEWNENENYISIGTDYRCQNVQWINSTLIECTIPAGNGTDLLIIVTAGNQVSNSSIYVSYYSQTDSSSNETPSETPTETPSMTPTLPGSSSSSSNDNVDDEYLFNPVITSLSSYNGSTGDMITIYGNFPSSYEDIIVSIGNTLLNNSNDSLNYTSNSQLSIILPHGYSSINISVSFGYNYSNQVEFTYNAPIILHVDHQNFNTADINRFFVFGINYGSISNQRLVIPFIDHPNGDKEVIHCEIESQCNNPFNQIQSIQDDDPLHPCVDNITLSNNQQYFNESKYDIYVCVLPSPGVGNGTIGFFDDDNMTIEYEGYSFEYSFLAPQIYFINDATTTTFNSTIQQGDIITIHGNQFPPTQEIFDMQLNKSSTIEWNENENYISIGADYRCQNVQWINSTLIECTIPPGNGTDLLVTVTVGNQTTSNSSIYVSYDSQTDSSSNETPTETPSMTPTLPNSSSSSSDNIDDEYLFNPVITSLSSYNGSAGDMITIYGYFPSSYNDIIVSIGNTLLNNSNDSLNYTSNTQFSIILPNGYSSINISVSFGYNYSNQVEFTYNAPIILHVDHQDFNTADINRFFVFGINYGSASNQRLVIPFIDHPNGEKQVIHCEVESQCNSPFNQIKAIQEDDPLHPCVDNITLSNNQQYFNESKYDIYVCVLPSPGVGNGTIRFFDDDNMTTVYEDYSFEYSFLAPQIYFINDATATTLNSTIQQGDVITIHGNQFPPTQEIFDMQLNKSSTIEWNENENYISIGTDYRCQNVQWINSTLIECTIPPGNGTDLLVTVTVGNQTTSNSSIYVSYDSQTNSSSTETPSEIPSETPDDSNT